MPQSSTASTISTAALVLRYVGFLLAGIILINAVAWFLQSHFRTSSGSMAAIGAFVMWGAASWVGQVWFKREQMQPVSGRVWFVAILCALVTYAVQVALVFSTETLLHGKLRSFGNTRDQMIIAAVFVGAALLELLIIRFGIGVGAKQADKMAQRMAAKDRA